MFLWVYLVGVVIAFYPLYRIVLQIVTSTFRETDALDVGGSGFIAFLIALGWPIVVVALSVFYASKFFWLYMESLLRRMSIRLNRGS